MPGEFDPANHAMPQQPLHRCMFPQAAAYSTFQSVTNPYEAIIGGVRYKSYVYHSVSHNSLDRLL